MCAERDSSSTGPRPPNLECLLEYVACARRWEAALGTSWRHMNASNERRHFAPLLLSNSAVGMCLMNGTQTADAEVRLPRTALLLNWDGLSEVTSSTLQIPCPSSVRWSASLDAYGLTPPWQSTHERPYVPSTQPMPSHAVWGCTEKRRLASASAHSLRLLMSFVGSGNTPFKAKLLDACRRLGQCNIDSLRA